MRSSYLFFPLCASFLFSLRPLHITKGESKVQEPKPKVLKNPAVRPRPAVRPTRLCFLEVRPFLDFGVRSLLGLDFNRPTVRPSDRASDPPSDRPTIRPTVCSIVRLTVRPRRVWFQGWPAPHPFRKKGLVPRDLKDEEIWNQISSREARILIPNPPGPCGLSRLSSLPSLSSFALQELQAQYVFWLFGTRSCRRIIVNAKREHPKHPKRKQVILLISCLASVFHTNTMRGSGLS